VPKGGAPLPPRVSSAFDGREPYLERRSPAFPLCLRAIAATRIISTAPCSATPLTSLPRWAAGFNSWENKPGKTNLGKQIYPYEPRRQPLGSFRPGEAQYSELPP
jgi:hypothetical protein